MAQNEQEIEAKFMVRDLDALRSKLEALHARLESPEFWRPTCALTPRPPNWPAGVRCCACAKIRAR